MIIRGWASIIAAAILLQGCAYHKWAPGPGMSAVNFEPDSAKCRLFSRGQQGGFAFGAAGSPRFVGAAMGGAALGYAIGSAVQQNQNFNDCMLANGWVVMDGQPVGNAAMSGSLYQPPQPVATTTPSPVTSPVSASVAEPTYSSYPTPPVLVPGD